MCLPFEIIHKISLHCDFQTTLNIILSNKELYNISLTDDYWSDKAEINNYCNSKVFNEIVQFVKDIKPHVLLYIEVIKTNPCIPGTVKFTLYNDHIAEKLFYKDLMIIMAFDSLYSYIMNSDNDEKIYQKIDLLLKSGRYQYLLFERLSKEDNNNVSFIKNVPIIGKSIMLRPTDDEVYTYRELTHNYVFRVDIYKIRKVKGKIVNGKLVPTTEEDKCNIYNLYNYEA